MLLLIGLALLCLVYVSVCVCVFVLSMYAFGVCFLCSLFVCGWCSCLMTCVSVVSFVGGRTQNGHFEDVYKHLSCVPRTVAVRSFSVHTFIHAFVKVLRCLVVSVLKCWTYPLVHRHRGFYLVLIHTFILYPLVYLAVFKLICTYAVCCVSCLL